MFFKCLLVFTLATVVHSDQTSILNNIIDDFLELGRQKLPDSLSLNSVTFPYNYKWLFFSKKGTVDCQQGVMKSMKSLKRKENTTLSWDDERKMKLSTSIGLDEFDFIFDQCTVDWFMIPKGPLQGKVGSNSIKLVFDIQLGPPSTEGHFDCVATITDIYLDTYADVSLGLVGKGAMHWVEEKILNIIGGGSVAKNMLNNVLRDVFLKHIPQFEILIKPILKIQSNVRLSNNQLETL